MLRPAIAQHVAHVEVPPDGGAADLLEVVAGLHGGEEEVVPDILEGDAHAQGLRERSDLPQLGHRVPPRRAIARAGVHHRRDEENAVGPETGGLPQGEVQGLASSPAGLGVVGSEVLLPVPRVHEPLDHQPRGRRGLEDLVLVEVGGAVELDAVEAEALEQREAVGDGWGRRLLDHPVLQGLAEAGLSLGRVVLRPARGGQRLAREGRGGQGCGQELSSVDGALHGSILVAAPLSRSPFSPRASRSAPPVSRRPARRPRWRPRRSPPRRPAGSSRGCVRAPRGWRACGSPAAR